MLKILETNKIPIHMIVGISAGSFIGSLWAYGYNGFQLQTMALSIDRGDIVDLTILGNGFIKGERLADFINNKVNNTPIEKLRIPFYAVATDIQSGMVSYCSGPGSGPLCLFRGMDSFLIRINSCRCSGVRSARIRSIVPRRCLRVSVSIGPRISA